jgi:hypothetical protein
MSSFGVILEGILVFENGWFLKSPDGTMAPLDEVFKPYENHDVRLTLAKFEDLETLKEMVLRGQEIVDDE